MGQNTWLENLIRYAELENLLCFSGFSPNGYGTNGIDGIVTRKGMEFKTSIAFRLEEKIPYCVIGHGVGEYATLEDVTIAIALPKTRGGFRANGGRKKIGGGQVKRSISFSADEEKRIQAVADRQGVSFSAYVRKSAVTAT